MSKHCKDSQCPFCRLEAALGSEESVIKMEKVAVTEAVELISKMLGFESVELSPGVKGTKIQIEKLSGERAMQVAMVLGAAAQTIYEMAQSTSNDATVGAFLRGIEMVAPFGSPFPAPQGVQA